MTAINIEYPTEEKFTSHVNKILAIIHGKEPAFKMLPVNQEYKVEVKVITKSEELSNEELCKKMTGMTPLQYQAQFGVAWNE